MTSTVNAVANRPSDTVALGHAQGSEISLGAFPEAGMFAVAAAEPELTGVAGWAVEVMEGLGSWGAGLLIALENLFPPLPSEVILPLAGFAASRGDLHLAAALLLTTLGSVLGAVALYYAGFVFGLERIRRIAGRVPLVKVEDVDRTMSWFHRHGNRAVFFGRMIPLFRSLVSIPAGVDRMPLGTFLVLTTLGSAIWNSLFVLAGYYLGEKWHVVEDYAGIFQKIVIGVVMLAVATWLVKKFRARGANGPPSRNNGA
ncbi:DedA family protein [Kocuria massiliensis]|uniref:DedA family protein n=1 Tax=Kocuria massiliensis TaxID=1926282 RepID=UPI002FD40F95